MDKKIVYYVIAGAVLILIVGIIIVMNQGGGVVPVPDGGTPVTEAPKSETEVNKDVAKELNLAEGQLPLRITMDDNGQSASLTPGKNITLMLGEDYDWVISSSNSAVLSQRAVDMNDPRVQAVYQVVGGGTAVLSAQGACKSGAICAKPAADFVFNVDGVISENFAPEDLVK